MIEKNTASNVWTCELYQTEDRKCREDYPFHFYSSTMNSIQVKKHHVRKLKHFCQERETKK